MLGALGGTDDIFDEETVAVGTLEVLGDGVGNDLERRSGDVVWGLIGMFVDREKGIFWKMFEGKFELFSESTPKGILEGIFCDIEGMLNGDGLLCILLI